MQLLFCYHLLLHWTDIFACCCTIITTLQIKRELPLWQRTPWSQFTAQSCYAPFQNQLHRIKETYHQQQYGGWYVWLHLVEQKSTKASRPPSQNQRKNAPKKTLRWIKKNWSRLCLLMLKIFSNSTKYWGVKVAEMNHYLLTKRNISHDTTQLNICYTIYIYIYKCYALLPYGLRSFLL